jgi:hypothetical protein
MEQCFEAFHLVNTSFGRSVAQVVSRWIPTAEARFRAGSSNVRFIVCKVALKRFSPSNLVSPGNNSSDCSTLIVIHHPGLVQ